MEHLGETLQNLPQIQNQDIDTDDDDDKFFSGRCDSILSLKSSASTTSIQSPIYSPITLQKLIGQGSFGKVYSALWNNKKVAVKQIEVSDTNFQREVEILALLRIYSHSNIIIPLEIQENDLSIDIVMEIAMYNLSELIQKMKYKYHLSKSIISSYSKQICKGLQHIHSLSICHRDLKPANILIYDNHLIKIADFGSAKILKKENKNVTYIVTRNYRAPECVLDNEYYTCKIDICAFGCIFAEMLSGKILFQASDQIDLLVKMMKIRGIFTKPQLHDISPHLNLEMFEQLFSSTSIQKKTWNVLLRRTLTLEISSLLELTLEWSPTIRLSALEVLNHKYFQKV